ncbi:sushi, von Willebrand factor type A, EGF and pentraxin domain-containing protein 1 [Patella vulgata]|uniref:sushi, von Willebrand factor type A, EGF and pentraxin domain-containing protein 1 n=1 Tax=Patella vulgata TaxID=6465 RepID=UPI0024A9E8EA|nr:sushi, von Willebrand factor type A, EGF and pentraxin domain-containing protein 1 [Patella vulgata]
MFSTLTIVMILLNTDEVWLYCWDDLPDPECPNLAAAGDCLFNASLTGTSCLCKKSCGTSDFCKNPKASGYHDGMCDCVKYVSECYTRDQQLPGCPIAGWLLNCYATNWMRMTYHCSPLTYLGDFTKIRTTSLRHGQQVEFQCQDGYSRVGGSRGLHVCNAGDWIKHSVFGDFPVCNHTYCGSPPRVLYATPSLSEGWFSNEVTYTCQSGTIKVSGDVGRYECSADGSWQNVSGSVTPLCQPYIANFQILPGNEAVANKTLSIKSGSSDIYCGALCLQSYLCVGYTYDDVNHVCLLNESGERAQNTEYTLIYPY